MKKILFLFFLAILILPILYGYNTVVPQNTEHSSIDIWIDADVAVGMKRINRPGYSDVDDGYAIMQLLRSDQVKIHGISCVFGNTSLDNAFEVTKHIVLLSEHSIPVYKGSDSAIDLSLVETNDAVEAMAQKLREKKLKILAIGPATNIGILLLRYPELSTQIDEIVLVAGRRSGTDYFEIGDKGHHAPDLNFDLDNIAFEILLRSRVPITLCPFEISNKVWITEQDLNEFAKGDKLSKFMADKSRNWLNQWIALGEHGFNPFDLLASHYLIAPEEIKSENLNAHFEIHKDDLNKQVDKPQFKRYLVCDQSPGYQVKFCYDVSEDYHDKLISSLTD